MNEIPWNEAAILIRVIPGVQCHLSEGIEDEGSLRSVISRLSGRRIPTNMKFKISFPDRRIAPYGYDAAGIQMLLDAQRSRE